MFLHVGKQQVVMSGFEPLDNSVMQNVITKCSYFPSEFKIQLISENISLIKKQQDKIMS